MLVFDISKGMKKGCGKLQLAKDSIYIYIYIYIYFQKGKRIQFDE